MTERDAIGPALEATAAAVPTLLLTLTGHDRPGVTTELFSALGSEDDAALTVVDVEQVVVRGALTLGVLLAPGEPTPAADVAQQRLQRAAATAQRVAHDLDLHLAASTGWGDPASTRRGRVVVTVLGQPLTARAVAGVTAPQHHGIHESLFFSHFARAWDWSAPADRTRAVDAFLADHPRRVEYWLSGRLQEDG